MMLGDAMGMPGELWPRARIRERLGTISDFIDGPEDNDIALYYRAGEFTDDSSQALVFLEAMLEHGGVPPLADLATRLIRWVEAVDGFERNVLGANSKAALEAHRDGRDHTAHTARAETNGAAMRIAPVGCLVSWDRPDALAATVADISRVTHATDVAIGGAAMIAQAVASAVAGRDFDAVVGDALAVHDRAAALGHATYAANCRARLETALMLLGRCDGDAAVADMIYEVIGTGLPTSESVPAALAIAYHCRTPDRCALMCANLGGDTDTIGAMATAVCGAHAGIDGIPAAWVEQIERVNRVSIGDLARRTLAARQGFRVGRVPRS